MENKISNNHEIKVMSDGVLSCPINLFRYFIRKQFRGVQISNKECDELRIKFGKYLHKLQLTEIQKENILPKSVFDVILKDNHPFRIHGFPPAYILHFTLFLEELKKEIETNNSPINEQNTK